jgi:FMN phosphatase YigB (HAD superfamily)
LKAVIFDFGHTVMREDSCVELMPGAREAIETIQLPKGIWANTKVATAADIRRWLMRAGLDHRIRWVSASFELGCRKPDPEFFRRALAECGLESNDVLFVGNQLDTDIAGANRAGIQSVYLAGPAYRSVDESVTHDVKPTFTVETLFELPGLVRVLSSGVVRVPTDTLE